MNRSNPIRLGRIVLNILGAFALSVVPIPPSLASGVAATAEESCTAKNPAQPNGGARIDYITPDGRVIAVPVAGERRSGASASMMDDGTLSCSLQEGETTFIISFLKTSLLDRFTFVNENASAQGEMRIAVSNDRLPADSPKWTEVSGKTEFICKRLFNLSLVGVEAHFVKLSFHVEKGGSIASLGRFGAIVP